jgi:NADPH2:quinone reductase
MVKAIRFHRTGGPEVLALEDVEVGAPGPGEARVRHRAIGVNFIDTYHRSGSYTLPLPSGLGTEAAGVIEALGPGAAAATGLAIGDRVAYAVAKPGSYAEALLLPAERLARIPDGVSDEQAASVMLKGMTVHYLTQRSYRVRSGDIVLLHAAAGGVGLLACQWLKSLGATVIGTVGSEEKAALARANGCDHAIVYSREAFAARVMAITGGRGAHVVYDSVGKDTIEASFSCLRTLGTLVLFGASSGPVPSIPVAWVQRGSFFFTRPSVFQHIATRDELVASASAVLGAVGAGRLKTAIGGRYPLADAARAHSDLEARRTSGSLILVP